MCILTDCWRHFSSPDLWPHHSTQQHHGTRPVHLQDSDDHGSPTGLLEPDPGPLGVHPAPAGCPEEDLYHHQASGGPEGQHLPPLGGQLLPQLREERCQQGLRLLGKHLF